MEVIVTNSKLRVWPVDEKQIEVSGAINRGRIFILKMLHAPKTDFMFSCKTYVRKCNYRVARTEQASIVGQSV